MTDSAAVRLTALTAGLVAFALVIAAYVISRTPDDFLGGDMAARQEIPRGGGAVPYTLQQGASAADVGDDLAELGVIESSRQFQLLVSLMGVQNKLSAGEYELPTGVSTLAIIDALTVKESSPVIRVTFPEGIRIEEMAIIAERAGFGPAAEFLAAVEAFPLPADLEATVPPADQLGSYRLEGYLFPDTYILPSTAKSTDLVNLMLTTFFDRFAPDLRADIEARGLTLHQAVTLAAIVEREAVIPEERPLIAGVLLNRLAAGDLLGADPTTQFVVAMNPANVEEFGWWKKELTLEDLALDSPYNTRLHPGLPPGPITNPGLASLEAVAHAEDTEFYYFVADAQKGDGSHVFAVTLEEHQRNIAEFGAP